jgi:S1-C subfamily serine protease
MANNKIIKIFGFFALGILGGIFADIIILPNLVGGFLDNIQSPKYINQTKEVTILENIALEDAIEKVRKTVIGVKTQTKEGTVIEGSGVIITSDGLAVTLASLVPQGSTFFFYVDGKAVSYQILKRDQVENLALIKLEKDNLTSAGFADISEIKLGERVFIVAEIFKNNIPKQMAEEGIIQIADSNFIQTNINGGKEIIGSALFDILGNAVGLNYISSQGKTIVIPVSKIKEFTGL